MHNIHKNARGKFCATYKGVEYEFDTVLELIAATHLAKSVNR